MAIGNLASRLIVGFGLAPFILLAIYADHHAVFWGVVFVASLVAMYEFFSMFMADRTDRLVSLLFGAGSVAALYWMRGGRGGELLAVFLATVPVALYYVLRFGDMDTAARRVCASIAGIVYGGFLVTFLAIIRHDFGSDGSHLVLLVLAVAWLGDTSAYFAGRFLGKTKLYPAVSPGKTWAGAVGGLCGSVVAGVVVKLLFLKGLPWVDVFLITIPGAMLGQLGDLAESVLKRSTGVKDSGSILPGHGGILDRIDAAIVIAPYVYLYLILRPQVTALF